jgi:hypothetical protein
VAKSEGHTLADAPAPVRKSSREGLESSRVADLAKGGGSGAADTCTLIFEDCDERLDSAGIADPAESFRGRLANA